MEAATALVTAGAGVDAANTYGNTPLHTAVFNCHGRGDLVQLLRASGADPWHRNSAGQTPAGLARLIANYDTAALFADLNDSDATS